MSAAGRVPADKVKKLYVILSKSSPLFKSSYPQIPVPKLCVSNKLPAIALMSLFMVLPKGVQRVAIWRGFQHWHPSQSAASYWFYDEKIIMRDFKGCHLPISPPMKTFDHLIIFSRRAATQTTFNHRLSLYRAAAGAEGEFGIGRHRIAGAISLPLGIVYPGSASSAARRLNSISQGRPSAKKGPLLFQRHLSFFDMKERL
jgi:hypothetical protein